MKNIDQLWLIADPHDESFSTYADKRFMMQSPHVASGGVPRSFVPGLPKNVWAQAVLDAFQAEEGGHIVIEGGTKYADGRQEPYVVRCHIAYDCLEVGRGEGVDLPTARLVAARSVWSPDLAPLEPVDT